MPANITKHHSSDKQLGFSFWATTISKKFAKPWRDCREEMVAVYSLLACQVGKIGHRETWRQVELQQYEQVSWPQCSHTTEEFIQMCSTHTHTFKPLSAAAVLTTCCLFTLSPSSIKAHDCAGSHKSPSDKLKAAVLSGLLSMSFQLYSETQPQKGEKRMKIKLNYFTSRGDWILKRLRI